MVTAMLDLIELWKHLLILILFAFCKKYSTCTYDEKFAFSDDHNLGSEIIIYFSMTM